MKTIYTYATPRPFGNFSMPVPAQNSCMREYASNNNYKYSLPFLELMYENCYAQLFRVIHNMPSNSCFLCYSIHMLPLYDNLKLSKIIKLFTKKNILLHFILEGKIVSSGEEILNFKNFNIISDQIDKDDIIIYV